MTFIIRYFRRRLFLLCHHDECEAHTLVEAEIDEAVLKKLEEVQEKIEKISEEAASEVLKIEKAFAVKKVPLLKERTDVIKQIPKFWLKAVRNSFLFEKLILN